MFVYVLLYFSVATLSLAQIKCSINEWNVWARPKSLASLETKLSLIDYLLLCQLLFNRNIMQAIYVI